MTIRSLTDAVATARLPQTGAPPAVELAGAAGVRFLAVLADPEATPEVRADVEGSDDGETWTAVKSGVVVAPSPGLLAVEVARSPHRHLRLSGDLAVTAVLAERFGGASNAVLTYIPPPPPPPEPEPDPPPPPASRAAGRTASTASTAGRTRGGR